jgi:S1-C subfamily serine protease
MADIFLSYSNIDLNRIKSLLDVLEQQGWSIWWDYKIRVGRQFDEVIEEELTKAKCIVVLWSKNSVKSDWVKNEAAEGKRLGILAPALIDNVSIPLEFRRIEAAKLYYWRGDPSDPELKLLLHSIGEIIGQDPKQVGNGQLQEENKARYFFGIDFSKIKIRAVISYIIALTCLFIGGTFAFKSLFPSTSTFLEKVEGDGQVIPAGEWKNFIVKVVDARRQPVVGAKVAWQTPECGLNVYVGETDKDGITSATNMCSTLSAGTHTQTATLVQKETPKGFTQVDRVVTVGQPVIFTFQFFVLGGTNATPSSLNTNFPRGRVRPLRPGISIGGINRNTGTIGLLVKDIVGQRYIVGAGHTFGDRFDIGKEVLQPGPLDGGKAPEDVIGIFVKYPKRDFHNSIVSMIGLVKLDSNIQFDEDIPEIGPIHGVSDAFVGQEVRKFGRTTGLTIGKITDVVSTVNIMDPFENRAMQFNDAIKCKLSLAGGDSGAVVVDEEGYVIGIIVAGSEPEGDVIVAPIKKILDALGQSIGTELSVVTK